MVQTAVKVNVVTVAHTEFFSRGGQIRGPGTFVPSGSINEALMGVWGPIPQKPTNV